MFEIADRVLGAYPDNVKQSITATLEWMAVSACKIYQSVLIFFTHYSCYVTSSSIHKLVHMWSTRYTLKLCDWACNENKYYYLKYTLLQSPNAPFHTAKSAASFMSQHMIEHNGPLFICWLRVGRLPASSGFPLPAYVLLDSHAGYWGLWHCWSKMRDGEDTTPQWSHRTPETFPRQMCQRLSPVPGSYWHSWTWLLVKS